MKTLVILLGNARGGEETWNSMYKHLLEPLNADLALLFGKTDNKSVSLYSKAKYVWELEEYKDWKDYYVENCKGLWYEVFNRYPCSGLGGGIESLHGSGGITFAFRHFLKNNFKHIGELYDQIILTRSDFYYIDDHPVLPNDTLYIVEGEDWGGVTDRHHVFPVSLWDKILGIVEHIEEDKLRNCNANPEQALKQLFNYHQIEYKRFKRTQFTVAVKEDPTRWCRASKKMPGSDTILLKYVKEYDMAIENLQNK